jgi:hypothetical protein
LALNESSRAQEAEHHVTSRFRASLMRLPLLVASILAASHVALATETDQFTTPTVPLYDIGPTLSRKVVEIIESDHTGDNPEQVLSAWAGRNVFASRPTRWVKDIQVAESPVLFRPSVFDSVYRLAFSPVPASFWFDSPTVNLHGYYMGTDKIDHFFRQGHVYFELVMQKEAEGVDETGAIAVAVAHGVNQEHTYLGTLTTGVYSNGDLAANYAGMKFYLNLRQPVRIGERLWPPLFERSPEGWRLRPEINPDRLLEPFVSDHLDESLNPSRYRFSRRSISSRIRDRCDAWVHFYADRLALVAPSGQSFATNWFGEEYVHWLPPTDEVSIATECDVHPSRHTLQVDLMETKNVKNRPPTTVVDSSQGLSLVVLALRDSLNCGEHLGLGPKRRRECDEHFVG